MPPQQNDWWAMDSLDGVTLGGLPPEVMEMVKSEAADWPMGLDEAKRLRLELMEERTRMTSEVEKNFEEYNLCEH